MKIKTLQNNLYSTRLFGPNQKYPLDNIEWDKRDLQIMDYATKQAIFDQKGIEVPITWNNQSAKVVASKYLYKGNAKKYLEGSFKQLFERVSGTIVKQGIQQNYFTEQEAESFKQDLNYLFAHQMHSFNSPVWFNVGLSEAYGVKENRKENEEASHWAWDYEKGVAINEIDAYERPQCSACFIQSIDDNMADILNHGKKEGMLFKYGSGTGTNFSPLRGINEPLSGGGVASGFLSFMRIYDIIAGRIQSGGKTRRAAKMVIGNCDHPDLYRFINWKVSEERKALWLSANPEWAPKFPGDLESEAYKTVDGQNGNNSVRVSDGFMQAALKDADWDLWFRTADKFKNEIEIPLSEYKDDKYLPDKRFVKKITNKRKTINAKEALEQIARAAFVTGDPGLQYDDNINNWHTCPNSGRINANNPCSEFMDIDNSACNLSSHNLYTFRNSKTIINIDEYENAINNAIIAQDILVDFGSYPSQEIAENSHKLRPLGLGYTNIGALLMENGIAYDSDDGRALVSAITSLMTSQAYKTSANLAAKLGTFDEFEKNKKPMLNVLKMHEEATYKIETNSEKINKILEKAKQNWEEAIELGKTYGFRNSQVTLLAPTGTIGFMMGVDCTGIEPMVALKSEKGLAGGGSLEMKVADCVVKGLQNLNYSGEELKEILKYINENETIVGAPGLKEEHYKIFQTALNQDNTIPVDGHLKMMAAAQPFLSGAISKTVNLPKSSTIQDVQDTYIKGWELGLKSISLYVDGSKGIQPVNIKKIEKKQGLKWGERIKPDNPVERYGRSIQVNSTGIQIMFGEYQHRPPKDAFADVFVEFGSSGSNFSAIYTAWAKEASRNRQRGMGLEEFIKHNKGSSDPVNGFTNHQFIKTCSGIKDLIAKLVQFEYLGDTSVCDVEPTSEDIENLRCNILAKRRKIEHYGSRIKFIDKIMQKGEVTEIFPLYEDELEQGELGLGDHFCLGCGAPTVLSGASCRKCTNCGDSEGCG